MNKASVLLDTKASIDLFISKLGCFSEEEFVLKPTDEVWSLSQLYFHMTSTSNFYFLANSLRCIEGRKGQEGGEKTQNAVKMLEVNSFPPIKIKIPNADIQTLNGFKTQNEYKAMLDKIMTDTEALLFKANENDTYKTESMNLGWLNSMEWLQLHAMHFRHHIKQLDELSEFVKI